MYSKNNLDCRLIVKFYRQNTKELEICLNQNTILSPKLLKNIFLPAIKPLNLLNSLFKTQNQMFLSVRNVWTMYNSVCVDSNEYHTSLIFSRVKFSKYVLDVTRMR